MSNLSSVALLFGGRSAEHQISLQSTRNIYSAIDKEKYKVVFIGIDKNGGWYLVSAQEFEQYCNTPTDDFLSANGIQIVMIPGARLNSLKMTSFQKSVGKIDIVFPVLHGSYGEDGTVQGMLRMLDLPFVGADVLGSAIGMDKDVSKRLLQQAGIPVAKFLAFRKSDKYNFSEISTLLGVPFFVKPANLGSSIGIHKIHNEKEFKSSVQDAFRYDNKIIFEEYIRGREIECSVLGLDDARSSEPGEIKAAHEFYDYSAKYEDQKGAELVIPADLSPQVNKEIKDLAVRVFNVLECEGMARVDFFVTENDEVVVNELNSIPGFTRISMYPKLWEHSGLTYPDLVNKLLDLSIEKFRRDRTLQRTYRR